MIPFVRNLEPCIPPGGICLPYMYQLKVTYIQLKVFERRALGTIYLITLIELFVHIEREKHSLRVLTPF